MTHEIIVKVPDTQLDFFKELLDNLKIPFQTTASNGRTKARNQVPKPLTSEQQAFVNDLRQSFKEVEAAERGDIKLRTLADFIDELDQEAEASLQKTT